MRVNEEPIIVEQILNTSKENVWNAVTKLEEMTQWFFENIPSFEPKVGFKTQFEVHSGDRIFTHLWEITEVIPNVLITYNWKYKEYPGDSFVTFKIIKEDNKTKLRLSTKITEDFQEDISEFTRESCLGGWHYFIKNRLKEYIDTKG